VDAGVDYDFPETTNLLNAKMGRGTKNIMKEPAMTIELCRQTMDKGSSIVVEVFEAGSNIISFGEMGIGNTASASLLMHKYTGHTIEDCTGRGAGHDDAGLQKKINILKNASLKHTVSMPFEILATYGGFEIAMICGAMLQARKHGMVILDDGFIVTSALLAAFKFDNSVIDNCIFCHHSQEKGHTLMLNYLGVEALVDLHMRLGEGTGAAVTFPLVQSAVLFLNEMASFDDAGVTNK